MDNGAGGQLHSLIGGRSLGGRYQNNIKRVSILWLYLEHGPYGKHRNSCIFDGAAINLRGALQAF